MASQQTPRKTPISLQDKGGKDSKDTEDKGGDHETSNGKSHLTLTERARNLFKLTPRSISTPSLNSASPPASPKANSQHSQHGPSSLTSPPLSPKAPMSPKGRVGGIS